MSKTQLLIGFLLLAGLFANGAVRASRGIHSGQGDFWGINHR